MSSRSNAIKKILDNHPNAIFVLSNGLTTREAIFYHREDRCFYMLHAMGESLAVGAGLAKNLPSTEVVVIDGDYNAIMGLASWSLLPIPNLHYYVLANGISETTGGQFLPSFPVSPVWCNVISIDIGKEITPNPPSPDEIINNFFSWLKMQK